MLRYKIVSIATVLKTLLSYVLSRVQESTHST